MPIQHRSHQPRQHRFVKAFARNLFLAGLSLFSLKQSLVAQTRTDINLDGGWQFIRSDIANAQNTGFDDSSWTSLNLPHTWNNIDGQNYGGIYQGIGWYRTHYTVGNTNAGKHFFLKFEGAYSVADIWINGNYVGEHLGAFAAFVFDVTTNLNVGADNVIAVKVNNAYNADLPPLGGFTASGGLYRDVHLLVTDPLHVSPLDFGSPGVYLKTTSVSSNSAALQVTTIVSNANVIAKSVTLRTTVFDAASNSIVVLSNSFSLNAASASNVVQNTTITNPHLWNGLADPYLYRTLVETLDGTNVTDQVTQPLGFRWFSVDPTNGFFLNGRYYDLHGVDMHQYWFNMGMAITTTQRTAAFALLKELGATFVRLCHYQHADETYRLGDSSGIVLWAELMAGGYTASANYTNNARRELQELIRQNFNHPSICFWSLYNEPNTDQFTNILNQLQPLAKAEDPTRLTTGGSNVGDGAAQNFIPDVLGWNKYYGWYSGVFSDLAGWADNFHNNYPARGFGLSEFGAGASIYQHQEIPTAPVTTSNFHPEEWQDLFHEAYWPILNARKFIWCKSVWVMFDCPANDRNEGDTPGRNDKGLVTIDGQTRKDAFYYYKSQWTTNPMVYITGHTFTNRLTNNLIAKIYANCDSVQLFLNGVSQGSRTSTNRIFNWPLAINPGSNSVTAIGTLGGSNVTDSLAWFGPIAPPTAAIVSPTVSTIYLNSTNDTLLLTATASNPPASNPLTTTWSQTGGAGSVTFGSSNALTTTANFSATGSYTLNFSASNGATTNLALAVFVGATSPTTNGLLAWWKMDETGGTTAADSSTNARTATVSGATFATGIISNAMSLNGSSSASFVSPDTNQITLAAWVWASGQGPSAYPRIVDTTGFHFFFRFDGTGSNCLDFSTSTSGGTTIGEWRSPQNSVGLGAWYHVALSYDRTSAANLPAFYVNGVKLSATTLTMPSATIPSYAGTGYLGNRAGSGRGWNGLLDDVRIYNRILSDAEVQSLASPAPPNLAPVVNAGTNQIIFSPATANLVGTVADDGKPTPPGAVTVAWSKVSGPGAVAFTNSATPATAASFSAIGIYGLQLAANDGQVSTVGSVTVTVLAPPAISLQIISSSLQLSWPTNGGVWGLQYQKSPLGVGLQTNWQDVSGTITNPFWVPIDSTNGAAFYRLNLNN